MSSMKETAAQFLEACESGKGWEVCHKYCHPDATFTVQADTFAEIDRLEAYTEAMKGMIAGPLPDGTYDLKSLAVDEERGNVSAYAVFKATHTGEGGPVPATGKALDSDYVYVMEFDGDGIRHMTKIWNDAWAMRQIGWG